MCLVKLNGEVNTYCGVFQVPSNYAPNYPMQQQQQARMKQQQYGTLPHPQIQMVHPVQQQQMDSRGLHKISSCSN